jgi:mono/diheme cytochrome c family protein
MLFSRIRPRVRNYSMLSATSAILIACSVAPAQTVEKPGEKSFTNYCATCHQYVNPGMGEAPPLHNSPWVDGPEERLVKIVLHGVRGRLELGGKVYDREMPGFGAIFSDQQLAELVSFVRMTLGKATKPVSQATVQRIRERYKGRTDYWPADELLADK